MCQSIAGCCRLANCGCISAHMAHMSRKLETKVQTADEFVRTFVSTLPKVLHHDFIARQQAQFLQEAKSSLKAGEFLVVGDFAENYSFVV
jgi:hypothetical protein